MTNILLLISIDFCTPAPFVNVQTPPYLKDICPFRVISCKWKNLCLSWPVLGCCSFCFEHMGCHIFQEVKENITSFSTDILKRKFVFFENCAHHKEVQANVFAGCNITFVHRNCYLFMTSFYVQSAL